MAACDWLPYAILGATIYWNVWIVRTHIRHLREGRMPGQVRGPDGRWIDWKAR
jgi:hypothetical protein